MAHVFDKAFTRSFLTVVTMKPQSTMTTTTTIPVLSLSDPDPLYGQVHPHETPELLEHKLKALEEELVQTTNLKKRQGYDQAVSKCPEQLTNDFKLRFLRCEVFNVQLAAERLMNYWNRRIESFGPDKAFLPMTQKGALKDDWKALEYGFFSVLPAGKGAMGRGLVYVNLNREVAACEDKSVSRESMHRATWYMTHVALEDLETQKHGLVYLIESKNANVLKVDNKLSKMNQRAAKGAIPVRMTCFHMVHPPALMGILWPLVKRFLSKRLLKRMKIHYASSDDDILIQLAEFEITKETVPVESGGALPFDPKGWIEARRDQEK